MTILPLESLVIAREQNGSSSPAATITNLTSTANNYLIAASALPTPAPREQQQRAPVDFNGDNKTDYVITRSLNATGSPSFWYIHNGSGVDAKSGQQWGMSVIPYGRSIVTSADFPVPGDYDGDGRTDIALFNRFTAQWSILPTTGAPPFYFYWGQANEIPTAFYVVQEPLRFVVE